MHEYGLTKRMVQIVNDTALAHHSKRVLTVSIAVGENSGVIPGSIQLYFSMIARGTPAQGAALQVRVTKAEMHCPQCGKSFQRPHFSFACPLCGTLGTPVDMAGECYVERVELED